jgi:hypothetical protein
VSVVATACSAAHAKFCISLLPACPFLSVRCQEGDQLRAVARVRRAAGLLAAAGEPRLLLPPGAQRAGSNGVDSQHSFFSREVSENVTAALHMDTNCRC